MNTKTKQVLKTLGRISPEYKKFSTEMNEAYLKKLIQVNTVELMMSPESPDPTGVNIEIAFPSNIEQNKIRAVIEHLAEAYRYKIKFSTSLWDNMQRSESLIPYTLAFRWCLTMEESHELGMGLKGFVAARGQALDKEDFPKLYEAIGAVYGSSSDNKFNVPAVGSGKDVWITTDNMGMLPVGTMIEKK